MKIALVIERMDVSRGGRETSTAQVAAGLAGRSHAVTILCRTSSWRHEAVQICRLGERGLLRAVRLRNFIADVQKTIRRRQFDVVHAMLPVPGANVYQLRGGTSPGRFIAGLRRRSRLGAAVARLVAPLNLHRMATARTERLVVEDHRVLCLPVSEMIAEELHRHYGRAEGEGVRVIYNAVEVPETDAEQRLNHRRRLRGELGLKDDETMFLTVAKNFELKGVAEAIAAFAQWLKGRDDRPGGKLVVIGRQAVGKYRHLAVRRGVGDCVVFVPPVEDVFPWYAAADVCVLLSWYDPCSRVALEATRWGVPSITTVYNGAAEVLAAGAGVVVGSPKDLKAVVAAMEELADPRRRSLRADACRNLADRLSMKRHVDELIAAYGEILEKC
ncbi:MAG: glycosyltransferase family 4 protein [Planctomycetota bacterium]|nr:glycosyltransferase family 4 protein [Planctomycetota bacterium]